jgi:hypothetical protein
MEVLVAREYCRKGPTGFEYSFTTKMSSELFAIVSMVDSLAAEKKNPYSISVHIV